MKLITFENIELHLHEDIHHEFLLTGKEVAKGYNVTESTIRSSKNNHKDELIEGKHFIIDKSYKNTPKILWTKRGIIRLGFFIKSDRAKKFRDFVEDLTLKQIHQPYIHQLERENIELKRAMNRLLLREEDKTLKEENKKLKYEVDRLKLELVKIKDMLHDLAQNGFPLADTVYKLYCITNRFQTLSNIAKDGKNLNTDTKAGLEYWHEKYKEIIDEAYKARKRCHTVGTPCSTST